MHRMPFDQLSRIPELWESSRNVEGKCGWASVSPHTGFLSFRLTLYKINGTGRVKTSSSHSTTTMTLGPRNESKS